MKKQILLFLIIMPFAFAEYEINYFINDYSNILSDSQILEIEPILKEIFDSKIAEYSIVIIDSLEGRDINSYAYELAEGNLGDKTKNNGLLLLVALNDRQYRFEVGRGIEDKLPDIAMGRIGRNYLEPNFKNQDYALGIKEASLAIKALLTDNIDSEYYVDKSDNGDTIGLIIFIILFTIVFLVIFYSNKSSKHKRSNPDYFTAAWILSQILKGGKGGSGGFGGFGGGGFGGGGARGGW